MKKFLIFIITFAFLFSSVPSIMAAYEVEFVSLSFPYDQITWMDVNRRREARERISQPRVIVTVFKDLTGDKGSGSAQAIGIGKP